MAKSKVIPEEDVESTNPAQPSVSAEDSPATEHSNEVYVNEFSHIPDIPAQLTPEENKQVQEMKESAISASSTTETEIEFLNRILCIQEEGGFGRHLTPIIVARIKAIS